MPYGIDVPTVPEGYVYPDSGVYLSFQERPGDVHRSCSLKKIDAKSGSKRIEKAEKTGRWTMVAVSPRKIMMQIPASFAAASTASASTGVSSTYKILDVEVEHYVALTIPPRSFSCNRCASSL